MELTILLLTLQMDLNQVQISPQVHAPECIEFCINGEDAQ